MTPELTIFDCDGVLVDTERVANRILAEMLTAAGYPITMAGCVERFMGRPGSECFPEVEAELGRRLPTDFVARYDRRVIDTFLADPRPVEGVVEAMEALPGRRCVASSSDPAYLRAVLGRTGLWERFERVFSATEVARGKPAPDVFLHAAGSLGVDPAACLVVEDSVAGVRAAVAAGMAVVGYAGLLSAERLAAHGARTITHMAELPGAVAGL